jgi:hypothetical protein
MQSMAQQITPPHDNSFIELLSKALLSIVQKLSDPILLFVIAICLIALLAAIIGGESLVIELRIFLAFLAVVGIAAVIVLKFLPRSTKAVKPSGGAEMSSDSLEKVQVLRRWAEVLTDVQFRELIVAMLTPSEQDELSQPVTKGSFLGDMHRWGKLDSVEQYLRQKFPDRFPE